MLTNWFSQPAGTRSSAEDLRGPDAEDDTLVMEPDQGNGERFLASWTTLAWLCHAAQSWLFVTLD